MKVYGLPARSRMTWSSRGNSVKWGMRLAHSTKVNSCLSAAWQMFVTVSFCKTILRRFKFLNLFKTKTKVSLKLLFAFEYLLYQEVLDTEITKTFLHWG